ncbi:hypothetical protein EAO68_15710, partial [Streptomyces sp. wa22]
LAALLLAAGGASPHDTLSLPEALGVGAVTMALVAVLGRPGTRPGLRHAAASGITSGVGRPGWGVHGIGCHRCSAPDCSDTGSCGPRHPHTVLTSPD